MDPFPPSPLPAPLHRQGQEQLLTMLPMLTLAAQKDGQSQASKQACIKIGLDVFGRALQGPVLAMCG